MYYSRSFNKLLLPLFSSFIFIFCAYLESANGYLVGRLLSLQNVADAHKQLLTATVTGDHNALLQPPLVVIAIPEISQKTKLPFEIDNKINEVDRRLIVPEIKLEDNYEAQPLTFTKKSLKKKFPELIEDEEIENNNNLHKIFNVRPVRDPMVNGARNCFFTPIQCMIQHDMSKYRKLVDSDIQLQRSG
ncbi:hypothetical protein Mgra_00001901 [Meloidogyne graminicola]|uniref:Uncharacterized protein n=1 Tax=Meloidogyne graminicola TaxID=189291 RepID=A0A8S9ZY32_9BILA|nr:hypothetical protein Mgra_00001901 [Meloidogyne graminicola]